MKNFAIEEAIKIAGSQGKLAKLAGITQGAVGKFLILGCRPKYETALNLENAVDGQIKWYRFISGSSLSKKQLNHRTLTKNEQVVEEVGL